MRQFRDPPPAPRPPKPVALPRGRKPPSQPERSRSNEEAGGTGGGAAAEETRTSPPIAQPRRRAEEQENEGDPEVGKKAAPLKPKRTRRAQSCDKLESDRGRNPGSGAPSLFRNSRIWDRMMDRRSLNVVAATAGSCDALSSPGGTSEGT
ncbi:capping protein, Arp2/3 and myosin-I linker protein 3-like [Zootoca vivipara]|uniref:capping protein, Arp2/3 and myosin-I linker protein 3-like n=1 Tax=Zootoca vivipara TaxID=8524 RepID=UPI00293B947F|nr:capping protein, Arp2/3 and myosin-I linker protein 3-like [Zootoca vivipara]